MIYGIYQNASGISNALTQQDLISNNLANAETVGFKRLLASYAEHDPAPMAAEADELYGDMTGGRVMLPTVIDRQQGGLEQTENPLDAAFFGEGFFTVTDANGQPRVTRDGRFILDGSGRLALASDPAVTVLDEQGLPIELGTRPASSLHIDVDGTVRDRVTNEPLAKLGLATAEHIRPVGGNLFAFEGDLGVATEARLQSGYLERSNVDPTLELTRLIEVSRLLEANANMIRYQDQALGKLIEAGSIG